MPKKLSVHSTSQSRKKCTHRLWNMKHSPVLIRLRADPVSPIRLWISATLSDQRRLLQRIHAFSHCNRFLMSFLAQGLVEKGLPPVLVYFKEGEESSRRNRWLLAHLDGRRHKRLHLSGVQARVLDGAGHTRIHSKTRDQMWVNFRILMFKLPNSGSRFWCIIYILASYSSIRIYYIILHKHA